MSALAVEMLPVRRRFSRDLNRPKPKACRNLFGTPDREELDRCSEMIASQLQNIQEEERLKYNFDFVNDNPLDGQYEWTCSDPQDIPSFYRPVNITHTKRMPRRTCPSLGFEASGVTEQERCAKSNTSVIPVNLQARLMANTSRTDEVEESGATSASATPSTTASAGARIGQNSTDDIKTTNRPTTSTKSFTVTQQLKMTDFLQHRKRSPERSLDKIPVIKKQRVDTMDRKHQAHASK